MNNVDGIYGAQLGIEIQVPSITVYVDHDPVTNTTDPEKLLTSLQGFRQGTLAQQSYALTHLFTGDLDSETVGIALTGTLCKANAVSLTQSSSNLGMAIETLIAAHEIGHNFGAPHDGDPKYACASTSATTYLMAPRVSSGDRNFSQPVLAMQSRSDAADYQPWREMHPSHSPR